MSDDESPPPPASKSKPKVTVVPSHGRGALLRSGGPGRPPNEFKETMRHMASRDETLAYVDRCLRGEFGPRFFAWAMDFVSNRGYDKPTQPVSGDPSAPLVFRVVHE